MLTSGNICPRILPDNSPRQFEWPPWLHKEKETKFSHTGFSVSFSPTNEKWNEYPSIALKALSCFLSLGLVEGKHGKPLLAFLKEE